MKLCIIYLCVDISELVQQSVGLFATRHWSLEQPQGTLSAVQQSHPAAG